MARRESRAQPRKACCMVSELLEESGIDREKARQLKRQLLEGLILMCRWQLERMEVAESARSERRARRVKLD